MTAPIGASPSVAAAVESYVKAFDENDLDAVMRHFADDAVYRTGTGAERLGVTAIRHEFEPQFKGVYGAMRFDELDRIVDEQAHTAATRWVCRHDLAYAKPVRLPDRIERVIFSAVVGERFGWEGVDLFHFNADGLIAGLFTYGNFPRRPRVSRALGISLGPMPQRRPL